MSIRESIKVALFCGGRGSATIIRALLRYSEVELSLIVNAYDDGHSTGALRRFIPGMLGPSDFRKNLSHLLGNYSSAQYALRNLLEYRFPASIGDADIAKLANFATTGNVQILSNPLNDLVGQLSRQIQDRIRRLLQQFFDYAANTRVPFDYRDCSFGNIVFAGAYLHCGSDFNAVAAEIEDLVDARAHILNVSEEQNRVLVGLKQDGRYLASEAEIVGAQSSAPILGIYLLESPLTEDEVTKLNKLDTAGRQNYLAARGSVPSLSAPAEDALAQADFIIYGPGTQYSSLFPSYRIAASTLLACRSAIKALVLNLDSDHDIQGLSASDLVDRALGYGAAITHIILSEDSRLSSGKLGTISYRGATIVKGLFATPLRPGIHNGTVVVDTILGLRNRTNTHPAQIEIFVDIHNRSMARDELVEEFLEIDWNKRSAHLILNRSNYASDNRLPISSGNYQGLFPELNFFRKWLTEGNADYLVIMTGDGAYSFRDAQNIIALLDQNTTLGGVFGSRTQSRRQFITSIQAAYGENRVLYWIAKLAAFSLSVMLYMRTGVIFSDPLTGLRVIRRNSLSSVPLEIANSTTPLAIVRRLIRHGVEVAELPVRYRTFSGFTDPYWRIRRGIRNLLSLLSPK